MRLYPCIIIGGKLVNHQIRVNLSGELNVFQTCDVEVGRGNNSQVVVWECAYPKTWTSWNKWCNYLCHVPGNGNPLELKVRRESLRRQSMAGKSLKHFPWIFSFHLNPRRILGVNPNSEVSLDEPAMETKFSSPMGADACKIGLGLFMAQDGFSARRDGENYHLAI